MRLELFDVRRRWPRQRTQRDDERGFVNSGIFFSLSSVQFVGLILPSNSHAEIKTRLYASAIFPISGDWDVLLPLIWNGLCDRCRAEITVMQFTGHSLPVHHWNGTFTLFYIISRVHLRDFFRLLATGMCRIRYFRNCRCDHHRAEITIMQFICQSLPAHHFFYGTVRIFTLAHIVSQAVFYINAFRQSSLRPHERVFERQTLYGWWGSENCCDDAAQRTVNRILEGRDTYSNSEAEHC